MSAAAGIRPYGNNYEHLEDELRWLDLLIRLKCRTLRLQNQTSAETQVSRAAYITPADVEWLLEDGAKPNAGDSDVAPMRAEVQQYRQRIDSRVACSQESGVILALPQLCQMFGLSAFEWQALVICLAPELRRKYDRIYAYLQDDITRQRPSVDLVLEMLCDTESERWSARRFLSGNATLLRTGILAKLEDTQSPSGSSGLSRFLKLTSRMFEFLGGSDKLDERLTGLACIRRPAGESSGTVVHARIEAGVWNLIEHRLRPGNPDKRKLVFALNGPHGVGKRELVRSICNRIQAAELSVDLELVLSHGTQAAELIRLALREALLQQAVVHFKSADCLLLPASYPLLEALIVAVTEYGWLVFLSGEAAWTPKDSFPGCLFQIVKLAIPDVHESGQTWERCLSGRTSEASGWAAELAQRFRLTPAQIRAAVELAENRGSMKQESSPLTLREVSSACRQQCNNRLAELATRIEPRNGWADIVLSEDKLAHLREICDQIRNTYKVFDTWGFNKKLSHGKGLSVLFTGPSGTGKTMAAEVLANEVDLDLYKVDLSCIVSKYIGETEKNLNRIFEEAETSNAILFFDEADALFGKRTQVSDAHDRYANIETSYLLQKMESYEGAVVLASNLRENMDEAFTRRIRFVIDFPFPDETHRKRMWQSHFPVESPMSPEIDFGYLAREFQVAGGSIRNIVLNAAFLAAANGGVNGHFGNIGMSEIMHGTRRELAKMGKLWNERHTIKPQ